MNLLIKTVITSLALFSLMNTVSASPRDYYGGYYGFGYYSDDYDRHHAYRHHKRHFSHQRRSHSREYYGYRPHGYGYDRLDNDDRYCKPRRRYNDWD